VNDAVASAIAAVFILACLTATIVACVVMLRRSRAEVKQLRQTAATRVPSTITADEVIDAHLALKDVKSLRELAEEVAA